MILSNESIKELIKTDKLKIDPFEDKSVGAIGVDLHLGNMALNPDTGEEIELAANGDRLAGLNRAKAWLRVNAVVGLVEVITDAAGVVPCDRHMAFAVFGRPHDQSAVHRLAAIQVNSFFLVRSPLDICRAQQVSAVAPVGCRAVD